MKTICVNSVRQQRRLNTFLRSKIKNTTMNDKLLLLQTGIKSRNVSDDYNHSYVIIQKAYDENYRTVSDRPTIWIAFVMCFRSNIVCQKQDRKLKHIRNVWKAGFRSLITGHCVGVNFKMTGLNQDWIWNY